MEFDNIMGATGASFVYPTLDPAQAGTAITLSGGNLTASAASFGGAGSVFDTVAFPASSDKYFEVTVISVAGGEMQIGVVRSDASLSALPGQGVGDVYSSTGSVIGFSSTVGSLPSYTAGDVIGVRYDSGTRAVSFTKNGGTPTSYTIGGSGGTFYAVIGLTGGGSSSSASINFGPTMAYSIPSGSSLLTA